MVGPEREKCGLLVFICMFDDEASSIDGIGQ